MDKNYPYRDLFLFEWSAHLTGPLLQACSSASLNGLCLHYDPDGGVPDGGVPDGRVSFICIPLGGVPDG